MNIPLDSVEVLRYEKRSKVRLREKCQSYDEASSGTKPTRFCYEVSRRSIKLILYKVLKLKNIKKDGYTCFQHQEQYEHDGPVVTRSQEGQRSQDDDNRLCLVDDLKDTSSSLKSMITTTFHKLKIELKILRAQSNVKA
ncbi:hypothetical protein Tco_0710605 [Tanacetum coccineum]